MLFWLIMAEGEKRERGNERVRTTETGRPFAGFIILSR